MEEINNFKPKLHLFVCVNDRSSIPRNSKPSCSPTITPEMVKEVKQWLVTNNLVGTVYCTKVLCLGFCNPEGGVICIWPTGRFVKGIKTVEEIKQILIREMNWIGLKTENYK